MKPYDDCIYCSGEVIEKVERLDYRYHGQLFIIEDVPIGICNQCGERFLKAEVAKKVEAIVSTPVKAISSIAVPVFAMPLKKAA